MNKWINNELHVTSSITHAIIKRILLKLLSIDEVGIGRHSQQNKSRRLYNHMYEDHWLYAMTEVKIEGTTKLNTEILDWI